MKQEQLRKLLRQPALCGIYHLPPSGQEGLEEAAGSLDYPCYRVDLGGSDDIQNVLALLGPSLGFPAWYGANLDALKDCLTDFSWREASGYVLVLTGADALHAAGEPFAELNEVLSEAQDEWRSQGVPFWVFYDMRADGLAALPTLA